MYKYVYKGQSKVMFRAEVISPQPPPPNAVVVDEIKKYTDCRYVSANESHWHLSGYDMTDNYPAIYRLPIHEDGHHTIIYQEGMEEEAVAANAEPKTMLTEYFKKCTDEFSTPLSTSILGQDGAGNSYPSAADLTYQEFPKYYTFNDLIGQTA